MDKNYILSDEDIKVILSSLYAHLKQCKEFIVLDDKVSTFTVEERTKLEEKILRMENLLTVL